MKISPKKLAFISEPLQNIVVRPKDWICAFMRYYITISCLQSIERAKLEEKITDACHHPVTLILEQCAKHQFNRTNAISVIFPEIFKEMTQILLRIETPLMFLRRRQDLSGFCVLLQGLNVKDNIRWQHKLQEAQVLDFVSNYISMATPLGQFRFTKCVSTVVEEQTSSDGEDNELLLLTNAKRRRVMKEQEGQFYRQVMVCPEFKSLEEKQIQKLEEFAPGRPAKTGGVKIAFVMATPLQTKCPTKEDEVEQVDISLSDQDYKETEQEVRRRSKFPIYGDLRYFFLTDKHRATGYPTPEFFRIFFPPASAS